MVFRDMKPENIVLDAAMHAKLTDFGLAKADASAVGACSFVGSLYFVAPEATWLRNRHIDRLYVSLLRIPSLSI